MSSVGNEIQQMLDEVRSEVCLEILDEENDLTKKRMMEDLHITEKAAEYLANKMVVAGKWKKIYKKTANSSHRVAVYQLQQSSK